MDLSSSSSTASVFAKRKNPFDKEDQEPSCSTPKKISCKETNQEMIYGSVYKATTFSRSTQTL
ncbi:12548_t:CDS:2 [Ambispora leptoticha]|uniref:12548_t:CDS:1 n=1 Tax=Ambispora leptoticha TaxID=144679 RepID=A0A9N9G0J5_9GLOM|nr:12548_t:CDS:2 [Ambispora leptoticha]